jgi:hypothetical protein
MGNAIVFRATAATWHQVVELVISCTGDERLVVLLSPNWPHELNPQVHNVPSVFTAAV